MDLLYRRDGMPQEGELVMCNVSNVYKNGVFVVMVEYEKQGFIHISEVSPGRIRNINDFVKEGKVVICKVLRIDRNLGHIDLSLRRVSESQRRQKSEEIKQEQAAEKIIEIVSKAMGMKFQDLYHIVSEKILEKSPYIHTVFHEYLEDKKFLDKYALDEKVKKALLDVISIKIKPFVAELSGEITLTSYASNGVELIRDALKKAMAKAADIDVKFEGSGRWLMRTKSTDYKRATEKLREFCEIVVNSLKAADKAALCEYTIKEV